MDFNNLRRQQLDEQLSVFRRTPLPLKPTQGWVRTIRESLGMSLRQLGARAGMSKASVAQMEKRESDGTVTLRSLEKLAQALESEILYVVLPKRSLDETMTQRAHALARQLAKDVSDSMALEMQATSAERLSRLIEQHAARMLEDEGALWDDV